MNQIRAIQALNKREIENGVSPEASWHTDYRDTAFVNFGGLPYELTEGDVITIFSQYGEPVFLKLARDKESGKSKGFGWLKYEDQRSCDLAVDNLGGAEIAGRLIRVDHARYKGRDDEDADEFAIGWADIQRKEKAAKGETFETEDEDDAAEEEKKKKGVGRPMIKEEMELRKLIEEHDDDDPMKGFLIEEKKREIDEALKRERSQKDKRNKKHRHHHHHSSRHRSRRDESDDRRDRRSRRDATPTAEDERTHGRDAAARKEDPSRERDRERRRRGGDYSRHHDGEPRRDREGGDRDHRGRDENSDDRRPKRYGDEGPGKDRDRHHKRRRRSHTRSPQP
ncbi:putative RNA binding domain protein [Rosellinia necatrix]|uniref:Putative RNA binding domain protein n=1 Tax=Rosellinia necatrix TaxID=77044 RepID=A0A1W2TV02_ROSNE|nr:putative RNA binding domain protein [Rosellinia necatrix]